MTIITGGYSRPLVASLTPWQKARIANPTERKDWPPLLDAERLTAYEQYLALIENRPADAFKDLALAPGEKDKILLAVALPELLCNVWADAVWSDPPEIELPSTTLQDAWDLVDQANSWTEIGAWESVFAAAAFGHSVVRLYRDEDRRETHGSDVVIEEIDPGIFFPTMKAGSSRQIERVTLAWEEDRSDPGAERQELWQVRELHYVEGGQYRIVTQERRSRSNVFGGDPQFATVKEEEPDGVDFLPFVDMHAKRWRGRFWGVSELQRSLSLFDEVDHALSNIAEVLDYHGKPTLQVPASVLYGGALTKGADRVIGIRRPEETYVARYITYDGQLEPGLNELDRVIDLILLTNEVPGNYFGRGEAAAAQSGTSLKLQLQNYVKKATRWQGNETRRARDLVQMALRLDGQTIDLRKPPKVNHGSPLPVDEEQEARIETALYSAELTSRELSIRRLRRVPSDEIDEEIARIEGEKDQGVPPMPTPIPPARTPGNPDGNDLTDPNDPAAAPVE